MGRLEIGAPGLGIMIGVLVMIGGLGLLVVNPDIGEPDRPTWDPRWQVVLVERAGERAVLRSALDRLSVFRADIDVCHKRVDTLTDAIEAMANTIGRLPPYTVEEQKRYERPMDDWR